MLARCRSGCPRAKAVANSGLEAPVHKNLLLLACLVVAACGGNGTTTTSNPPDELKLFEDALVGAWYRYHGFDDSTDYFRFYFNRTGCEFTIDEDGDRKEKVITYWELRETSPGSNVFRIWLKGPQISDDGYLSSHEFRFVDDVIHYGGYDNLVMFPDPDESLCRDID
jgi:hypothetical protein